ncbi:MAG: hypothetical protein JW809_15965 [Pirellulales bacterium]|nr:hypothetical protein [Pirellulales bacterium]
MSQTETRPIDLFPLPLTAFERYMLDDHRVEYPMAFVLTMRLRGRIHREAMDEAIIAALARHPLLCATVDQTRPRRPCWVPARAPDDLVDWGAAGEPLRFADSEGIDLSQRPGVRLWIRQADETAVVTGQFHHPCCDGLGALRFLGDVLAEYGLRTATGADRPVLTPLDPDRLARRGVFGRDAMGPLGRAAALAGTLAHSLRFALCRPAPLRPAQPAPIDPALREPFPSLHAHTFDAAQSQRLADVARRRGATVNDLLLCILFRAIAEFNGQPAGEASDGWYRVLMPTSLRDADDALMPAANVVTMSFLARRIDDCGGRRDLLPGIQAETARVKHSRRGLHFIRAIELAQAVYGRMPAPLVAPRCFATVVLSNLGDVGRAVADEFPREEGRLRAGNLVLEEVLGAPPLRPLTRASLFVLRYAGRITLSLRCDCRHFLPADTDELLARFVGRIGAAIDNDCGATG